MNTTLQNFQKNSSSNFLENNLYELRQELNYTQEDFAELLQVSPKTISYYETGKIALPIQKAIFIAKKFNCSLDWLYCLSTTNHENTNIDFLVDIKKILFRRDNDIVFSISSSYWKYLKDKQQINNSNYLSHEKDKKLVELNSTYNSSSDDDVIFEFSIKTDVFSSLIRVNNKVSYPYIITPKSDNEIDKKIFDECKDFLISCLSTNVEEEDI